MKNTDLIVSANDIKPAMNGKSDFFSWNLYRFVKKNPKAIKIWRGTWNTVTGNDSENPVIYIGHDRDKNWIHARLLRNLCSEGNGLEMFAYGSCHGTQEWEDITDEFWKSYLEKGICAVNGDYAHKWIQQGDDRHCKYCKKTETKVQVSKVVTTWAWEAKNAS